MKRTFAVSTGCEGDVCISLETIDDNDFKNPDNLGIKDIEMLLMIKCAGNSNMTVKRFLNDYCFMENNNIIKMSAPEIKKAVKQELSEIFNNGIRGFAYLEV